MVEVGILIPICTLMDQTSNYIIVPMALEVLVTTYQLATMQWFVIAVTHTTGGLVSYYLNGVPVGTNTGVTFAQYASNNGEFIAIGDNYWYGDINTCAVYGRALSRDEIQQNYNAISAQYSNVSTNLVAYYNPRLRLVAIQVQELHCLIFLAMA
jgi:glycogen synthase